MNVPESYLNFLQIANAKPENKAAMRSLLEHDMSVATDGDDLESQINSLNKPVIEIGGPTPQGFKLIDSKKLDRFYVSNLASPGQNADENHKSGDWKQHVGSSGEIDFQSDGQKLPFLDESVGAILISAMINDPELNINIINESKRVLVKEGILLLEANNPEDVLYAINNGFSVVKWKRSLSNFLNPYVNIVLKKQS